MKYEFDGVLTSANGNVYDVDCAVTLPVTSGGKSYISIKTNPKILHQSLPTNPCTILGKFGNNSIELSGVTFRSFPIGSSRDHAREEVRLLHLEKITLLSPFPPQQKDTLTFFLSPVKFFKEHINSATSRYTSNPKQTTELFTIKIAKFGDIVFSKQWVLIYQKNSDAAATIHTGYYAEVKLADEYLTNIDRAISTFRNVCHILSIIFRQAVTIHGWRYNFEGLTKSIWLNPLEPNLAPYIPVTPRTYPVGPNEFKRATTKLINAYLGLPTKKQRIIRNLCIALAPHINVQEHHRFTALFSGLEHCLKWRTPSTKEKERIAKSNDALIEHLNKSLDHLDSAEPEIKLAITQRIEGFKNLIRTGAPSFAARLDLFLSAYPAFKHLNTDLWPIESSSTRWSLKDIRNALAHGKYETINHDGLSAATWHFSIFIERLIFTLCEVSIPKAISPHSIHFSREIWYDPHYWRELKNRFEKPET